MKKINHPDLFLTKEQWSEIGLRMFNPQLAEKLDQVNKK